LQTFVAYLYGGENISENLEVARAAHGERGGRHAFIGKIFFLTPKEIPKPDQLQRRDRSWGGPINLQVHHIYQKKPPNHQVLVKRGSLGRRGR